MGCIEIVDINIGRMFWLNNNMECIEMIRYSYKKNFKSLNNNIGCIEIRTMKDKRTLVTTLNNNMGCIFLYVKILS